MRTCIIIPRFRARKRMGDHIRCIGARGKINGIRDRPSVVVKRYPETFIQGMVMLHNMQVSGTAACVNASIPILENSRFLRNKYDWGPQLSDSSLYVKNYQYGRTRPLILPKRVFICLLSESAEKLPLVPFRESEVQLPGRWAHPSRHQHLRYSIGMGARNTVWALLKAS